MAAAQLQLADDYWLTAHDTSKGTCCVPARQLGIGLGAALLAELMFRGNVALIQGRLFVRWQHPGPNDHGAEPTLEYPRPDDHALVPVLEQLMHEERQQAEAARAEGRGRRAAKEEPSAEGQDVREWIAYLAADDRAAELVTGRLAQTGHVELVQRRTWTGKRVDTYIPRDSNTAGWPGSRISTTTRRGDLLDQVDLTLAGMYLATGLHQHALGQLQQEDLKRLAEQLRTRMHDMLRELVSHAEAAVGEAVMTRRGHA